MELGQLLVINCITLPWVADTLRCILQSLVIPDDRLSSCSGETEDDSMLVLADFFRF